MLFRVKLGGGIFQNVALNNAILKVDYLKMSILIWPQWRWKCFRRSFIFWENTNPRAKARSSFNTIFGPIFWRWRSKLLLDRYRWIILKKDIAKTAANLRIPASGRVVSRAESTTPSWQSVDYCRSTIHAFKTQDQPNSQTPRLVYAYAPAILAEHLSDWVKTCDSTHMQVVLTVLEEKQHENTAVHVDVGKSSNRQ